MPEQLHKTSKPRQLESPVYSRVNQVIDIRMVKV